MIISLNNIMLNITFLTTENSIGAALWYFFMILLVIIGVIATLVIFFRSKEPINWEHKTLADENYVSGSLTNLAQSIRSMPIDYSEHSSLRNHIEMMFFEKIRTIHGFSVGEIIEMKNKSPNKLQALISDKNISDWIFNIGVKEKRPKQGLLDKNKKNKKDLYLMEMNKILDKMEMWGE